MKVEEATAPGVGAWFGGWFGGAAPQQQQVQSPERSSVRQSLPTQTAANGGGGKTSETTPADSTPASASKPGGGTSPSSTAAGGDTTTVAGSSGAGTPQQAPPRQTISQAARGSMYSIVDRSFQRCDPFNTLAMFTSEQVNVLATSLFLALLYADDTIMYKDEGRDDGSTTVGYRRYFEHKRTQRKQEHMSTNLPGKQTKYS